MSVESFTINLDNPLAIYFCSQTITGHVALKLKKEKLFKDINIRFFGGCEVKWMEAHQQGNERRTIYMYFSSREVYMDNTVLLQGGGQDSQTMLPPGEHKFHFALILPPASPSSFEGDLGRVRYLIIAKISRPWRFDQECKKAFTVLNILDLNNLSNIQEPMKACAEKHLYCCCCRSGAVSINASFPFTGFVPGQKCQGLIEVDNQSNSRVSVKCHLVQSIKYTASCNGPKSRQSKYRESKYTLQTEEFGTTEERGSKNFTISMRIPAVPSSYLLCCNYIDINYTLKIEGIISGMHTNMKLEVPIVIGNIPFRNQIQTLVHSSYTTSGPIQSAPPLPGNDYPNLPPPSYEECVHGRANAIKSNDDNKDFLGDIEFSPRYPIYNFQ